MDGAVSFAERLRHLRERAGLSQEELAERAGLTPNAISALERGARRHPYPNTVRALADVLGLLDEERSPTAPRMTRCSSAATRCARAHTKASMWRVSAVTMA